MKMTAAVLYEQGLPLPFAKSQPFRIEEIEIESPGPGEVLVEVRAAGLCHSDLTVLEGHRKRPLPTVGGHEGAGIVREVGTGVEGLTPGDHVAMTTVAGCGVCALCRAGRPALCQAVTKSRAAGALSTGARRLKLLDGTPINHYSGISVFAQYAVVTPQALVKIDKSVPWEVAALFGCAVVTGAGAVFNSAKVRPGASVAVLGLGGVGLTVVMAAREAGAARIVGIDVLESKFDLAKALGATDCVNASAADATEQIASITDGAGIDYVFETSGSLAAIEQAQRIVGRAGEVIGVGLGRTESKFPMAQVPWVSEERVFRGCLMGSGVPQRDIPKYVDMYLGGRLPVEQLLSDHIGFEKLNEGFDLLQGGSVVRQVLLPHGPAVRN